MTLNNNNVIIASLKSETMDKLINRITGSRLLISILPGKASRTHVEACNNIVSTKIYDKRDDFDFDSFVLLEHLAMLLTSTLEINCKLRNFLNKYVLKRVCYRNDKFRKTFSKFYGRFYDSISKFQVGLKSLMRQGLSEPEFYGDLVYKLKKSVGSNDYSAQFIKIISHYKKIGYNINVLQQTACLVVNPITVGNFAFLFNCTPVARTSDSI